MFYNKKIFGHTWRFQERVSGLSRKRDFDVLRDKLGMAVENLNFSKIVNGYVFDFTKLHEELLFK